LVGDVAAGGENHLQMAFGIDDKRAEIVIDGSTFGFVGDAGTFGEGGDFVFRAGEETPVRRIILIIFAVGF